MKQAAPVAGALQKKIALPDASAKKTAAPASPPQKKAMPAAAASIKSVSAPAAASAGKSIPAPISLPPKKPGAPVSAPLKKAAAPLSGSLGKAAAAVVPKKAAPPASAVQKNQGAHYNDCGLVPAKCGLISAFPGPLQELCRKKAHIMEYLHNFSLDKFGVPEFYAELNRKLSDLKKKNLIYPVSDDVLIHILSAPEESRDTYIAIEPSTNMKVDDLIEELERRLVDVADKFSNVETEEERKKLLITLVDKICLEMAKGKGKSSLFSFLSKKNKENDKKLSAPTARELQAIKYLAYRDKIGMGVMDPMIKDKNIEDISCSGLGHIFVEHKVFKSLKSSIVFSTHDELDQFVIQLSERIKKPVTFRNPIVDAVLPDGSRINIVYGKEISKRGSNFSIRKFADTPLSILELVEFKSISYQMAAYLSLVIEEGMNLFVSGETASGKTTLLNAITTFVPSIFKIITIEDTPELQVPHKNWLREVSKMSGKGETGADVGMFDLLKAALRQRPNLIMIGEIRGEEGNIAFQAMQTGHQAMATFHASTVEKLIQRLTGSPINVPKSYIDNLNVVVIQNQVRLANGKLARRCQSISEIIGYDSVSNNFSFIEIFRWDPITDTFEFTGNRNSFLLEEKIAPRKGLPPSKKWMIYEEIDKRTKVLEKIHRSGGISGFYELLDVLGQAKKEGIF